MSVDSIYLPHRCVRCKRQLRYYHTLHLSGKRLSYRLGDQPHGKDVHVTTGSFSLVSPCPGCKTTTLGRGIVRQGRLAAVFEHQAHHSRQIASWPDRRGKFFSFLPFRA